MISPYAKQGFIDNTQGDFTSILKFIETVYSLQPLTARDAAANSLMGALDFSQVPRAPLVLPGPFMPDHYPLTFPNGTVFGTGASTSSTTSLVTVTSTETVSSSAFGVSSSNNSIVIAATLLVIPAIAGLLLLVSSGRLRKTHQRD
jgi:phospholipase C